MKRMIALSCLVLFALGCEEKKATEPAPAAPTVKEQPQAAPAAAEKPAEEAKADENAPAAAAEAKADDHKHGATCSCKAGKAGGTVWCNGCSKGYIKGVASEDKAAVAAALTAGEKTE